MPISIWIMHERVSAPDAGGATAERWIHRRTFYDEADLTYHLAEEAAYLYNPNPVLRIVRVDLQEAAQEVRQVQTPGAEPVEDAEPGQDAEPAEPAEPAGAGEDPAT